MAKPKHIDGRIWNDEKFHELTPDEKLLVLYSLTSQANRIGLFKFSLGLAAEDTGLASDAVREGVRGVCRVLGWRYDEARRVMFIPTWWKYNQPSTENVLKGMLDDLHELPESPLVGLFCRNLEHLPEALHEKFREECLRHKPRTALDGPPPESELPVPHETESVAPAEAPEDAILSIRVPRNEADIRAREKVIGSWNFKGAGWLQFR